MSAQHNKYHIRYTPAFTLIELLVVISIIGILIGLSIFGLQGARQSSRDAVRKADLEQIRSALGMYKADCDKYPGTADLVLSSSTSLKGDNSTTSCSSSNTYISNTPVDPISTNSYVYDTPDSGVTYEICSTLEQHTRMSPVRCNGSTRCGAGTCYYKVTNP